VYDDPKEKERIRKEYEQMQNKKKQDEKFWKKIGGKK